MPEKIISSFIHVQLSQQCNSTHLCAVQGSLVCNGNLIPGLLTLFFGLHRAFRLPPCVAPAYSRPSPLSNRAILNFQAIDVTVTIMSLLGVVHFYLDRPQARYHQNKI